MGAEAAVSTVASKLGTALYIRQKNKEQAEKAGESVDYLAEKGVIGDKPEQKQKSKQD